MNRPQVINTLSTKASELEGHIAKLERDIAHAKNDLAHVRAAMVLFEAPRENGQPAYMNINMMFRRGELAALCKTALQGGPKNTRELASWVIEQRGLDADDRYLRTAVAYRVIQVLRLRERRGVDFKRMGKMNNVVVWELA